ncbi:hypothetical protein J4E86_004560 [Alternaria arbusti]|uniref:uncharacterized protein n=1 Tax=Alternaria arbusti TaxID=232088 RepID=UPI002220F2FF|nr:uncharacterized protein J4E86_004560 [Alternaria arbusti]KAI4957422.1 hypothetical protein J4E86_004560 [Alternaria arbusti]
MGDSEALEPYRLTGPKRDILDQCFTDAPVPDEMLQTHQKRPMPSRLLHLLDKMLIPSEELKQATYRSISRAWDEYAAGGENPSAFMRSPTGAPYKIVSIEGKGRGVVATRDIKAGETVLQESPVLIVPHGQFSPLILLLLPKQALEAILLLHNAQPDETPYTKKEDFAHNRLIDALMGCVTTNAFEGGASFGQIGMVLLTGSMFNHESNPNVRRHWDQQLEQMVFKTVRDVKEGDEFTVHYSGSAENLRKYGI